jgi:gas vesicle protein
MESNCSCNSNSNSNSGFIFGLILGAIIGAVVAVIIYKNNQTEVFEKLQKKIKDLFQQLTGEEEKTTPKKPAPKTASKIIAVKKEVIPLVSKPKKPTPKMFVKPKK